MNGSKRDTDGSVSRTGDPLSGDDYRVREVEARLDRRLTTLEAQLRRARWTARLAGAGLGVAMAALATVITMVAPAGEAWAVDRLSTREIALRDADGVERGHMGTDAEGRAQLSLSDRDGQERIRLTVLGDGSPGVTIHDGDARPRAVLGYLPDGTTNLVFADGSGAIRTLVGVDARGVPAVSVFDEAGGEEGAAGAEPGGGGRP
jgi:hypothetical protein